MTSYTDAQYQAQFETFLLTEKRVSQNTFQAYVNDISQFLTYLKTQELTLGHCVALSLKAYVRHLHKGGMSARSLARKITTIKLLFTFLSERYGFVNYAEALVFPKIEKTLPVYLTEEEVTRLLSIARQDETPRGIRNWVMMQLLYATGVRISELMNLTTDQYHADTGFLFVTGKGNKQRDIPIPHAVCKSLTYYLQEVYPKLVPAGYAQRAQSSLFPALRKGKVGAMTRQAFWVYLKKLLIGAGIIKNVSPHTLRHSLATHLLKAGADIRSLQLLLGHEQINTVEIYTHLEKEQVRRIYDKKHPRA